MSEMPIEQAIVNMNADLAAMLTMQAFMIADLAVLREDPLEALHQFSDSISTFIITSPLYSVGEDTEAVRARMLKTVQETLDKVAGVMAKAFPKED